MIEDHAARLARLTAALGSRFGPAPEVAVVLGSGWKDQAKGLLSNTAEVKVADLSDWPLPRVEGHGGELRIGDFDGRRALFCTGRVHAYEGYSAGEIVLGVRALVAWGTGAILLLNAAGSLREDRAPGSLMPFVDHLNFGLPNPLAADQTPDGRAVFLDLVGLYDADWRDGILGQDRELQAGVYAGLPGPSYETPTEVGHLRQAGADAVGMSTVPEALAARAAGARVMAISLMTNWGAGIRGSRPSHAEVLATAREHGERAAQVLRFAVAAAPRPAVQSSAPESARRP